MSNGEGQRMVYYVAQDAEGGEKVALQPILPIQTFALGLNRRKNWGRDREIHDY
jgi:hypothetical protein